MEHHHHKKDLLKVLAMPVAIVLAGLFIGLSILWVNRTPKPQTLESTLSALAKKSGVSSSKFEKCLASGKYTKAINDSIAAAFLTGGNGTPWSIVVGPTGKKYAISGALPIEKVREIIDQALADKETKANPSLEKMSPVTSADHIQGDINAPVKVVEYSDLECPFCKRFHTTMQQVMKEYGKDKVAWVFRQFPLSQLHSKSPKEAEATECVAELGGNDAFWKFVDLINEVTPSNNALDKAVIN